MIESKKGLNPAQVQAPQSAQHNSTADECSTATSAQPGKRVTKIERAYTLILSSPGGVTEGDIHMRCGLRSGRNYPSKIERTLGVRLHRDDIPNPDGIDTHYRYRITNRADAERVAGLIDQMRQRRKAPALSPAEIANLMTPYPVATSTTETD